MFWKWCSRLLLILFALWLITHLGASLGAEILWFQEVDYAQVFQLKLLTQGIIGAIVLGITVLYLLANLAIARKFRHPLPLSSTPAPQGIPLCRFLPLAGALALMPGLLLLHYGQFALAYWHQDWTQVSVIPQLPSQFNLQAFVHLGTQLPESGWLLLALLGLAIALVLAPQTGLSLIGAVFSLMLGLILSGNWGRILQSLHPIPFQITDPIFAKDISFYIFTLPVLELLQFWWVGLTLYSLISVMLIYLLSGDSFSQGFFPGFSQPQQRHLKGLVGGLMLAIAGSYWLSRNQLLYSEQGVSYGASYTDVTAQLPAYTLLSGTALVIALVCVWQALGFDRSKQASRRLLVILSLYSGVALLASTLLPMAVQQLVVRPNELAREQPFIQRTIALTRQAFNLNKAESTIFNPEGKLTVRDLQANDLTIRNIRLWDQRPLLETNRQLQQIRLYYRFPDADLDRYTFQRNDFKPTLPNPDLETERQQVLIAARELDYSAVPAEAKTWVNQHLIYTHGYGFTLSPVNRVGAGGLPEYFVKDIGVGSAGNLNRSREAIRANISTDNPRIYYGELTNTYVMTGTQVRELDYPSGEENVYNIYDGRGGISLKSWRRWLFARYLQDWQMLLTQDFLPETKLLFRRNINRRIRAIAPFLRYDSDPYLVVADVSSPQQVEPPTTPSHLFWIVDAYTTTTHYPYSDPGQKELNYIRNSVKVVVDAYNGAIDFYVADPTDPIVQSWMAIFPSLFKPLKAMPASLRSHIRYPSDLFEIQAQQLMTYHMTDPQVFYNREDQWQIPKEIYGGQSQLVEPYYLITSLPKVPFEEFILLSPYTPNGRTNLVAWLAARSDGENYGKLLLYEFPKQILVYGPEQIEARINQDPVISQQISLWNRQGSRAIQGNLLVIPIEESLLYVEPIYLEAAENSLPTLVRVVVAYENQIVMAESLEQALQAIFQPVKLNAPAIVRPVE
ncbi:hypothetical protein BST81_12325 [Leptolyngbya sp. 'hensonii']|uniref:UPF0182 family protein n=1 Tax=Leptolyngbya sp. 'hensonii' TaxID=1922337 RepID=UPI00094F9916|nr:UPF0182 family protein [Leptolyngbya sp. 'hensonii']OLP17844.1 hypothetical protein BST81_12325 [Leptolyngbya sp. 'hensonii']